MSNMSAAMKFSMEAALVSKAHAQELTGLVSAPSRGASETSRLEEECSLIYGVSPAGNGKNFMFAGGMAVIPVYGALLHRDPWCDRYATGYEYIASRFAGALGDPDVKGILFDVNSYGGHVAGNFELCDMIYEARGVKPMAAIVDSRSLSGGYSIASSVGKIYSTPSGDIGSIGVVLMHISIEEALRKMGVEVTFIHAGKHKVDGNPFKTLPADVRKSLKASVDKSYQQFVSLVARNRGMTEDAVKETEARVFDATEAKALGLIDEVMPPRAAFAAFLAELNGSSTQSKEVKKMSNETPTAAAGGAAAAPATAAAPVVDQAAITAARNEGQMAAQQRIDGILSCDEAQKRPKLAKHVALKTSMSVEDAKSMLAAAAPEETAEAAPAAPGASALAAAMAASGAENTTVGSPAAPAAGAGGEEDRVARITSSFAQATGNKPAGK